MSPEQTSSRDKQRIALTLSEGIIGQWFGDYITMDSWENMWLVKGLSEYLKYNFTSSLVKTTLFTHYYFFGFTVSIHCWTPSCVPTVFACKVLQASTE